ncbi:hypothetical protein BG011_006009 [Mortierella polycephala]|uniref:DM2 domain-containing protein n=1 Tax=Mortierella polycephala TaxID=41804 RepID=A0A9P6U0J4_9FUNG|nr:hypothetical protein BG011_006009 [Mortierella polycephala]
MSNVDQYRDKVAELISQADITTVSARGIRKKVEALNGISLNNVKREFDEMVMEMYEKITNDIESAVLNGGADGHHQQQQQQQQQAQQQAQQQVPVPPQQNPFGFALPPTSYVAPAVPKPAKPKPAKPTKKRPASPLEDDDDDSEGSYSSVEEGNGRANKKAKSASSLIKKDSKTTKTKVKAKSKVTTRDEKKQKQKKDGGAPRTTGIHKPVYISDRLAGIIGDAGTVGPTGRIEMPRTQVVKHIWVYIRAHSLQDEKDRRQINLDDKLKALFGLEDPQISFFALNKYLSPHLTKIEDRPEPASA